MLIRHPQQADYSGSLGQGANDRPQAKHQSLPVFHLKALTTSASPRPIIPPYKTENTPESNHTKPKPDGNSYLCRFSSCNKTFKNIFSRRIHERSVHLDIKPFQCQICSSRFTQKSDLKKHYYIHSGEKPYLCLTCKKTFSQSSNLYRHIKTRHKIQPIKHENWIND